MRRFACCLALLLLPFGRICPLFAGQAEWIEVRSPHFSVVTDAGERRGREVALRFEQMRAAFGALMNKAKVSLPIPLQIVAFRNSKEMRQFVPLWQGKPVQLGGLFQSGEDRCFILLDMSLEDPWHVVFHEYAHQLLNGNVSARMQPWFDEGFAEYFSTVEAIGNSANIGKPPASSSVLQQAHLMKAADLFRVQKNSSTYNESGDHRSLFYAESWLVVHYIFDNQLMPKMATYYDLVDNQGVSAEQAIQQTFGMSPPEFDKTLQHYFNDNRYRYYTVTLPAGIDSSRYTARHLSELDARAVLADTHLHSPDYHQQAIGEFEEILKQQPANVPALRGLGYSYLMQRDFERAAEMLSKAAELDSNDSRVLYYSAVLAQRRGLQADQAGKVQQQLEKSISLDPDFADAYNVLAFVYLSQAKQQPALDAMRKAVELNPQREDYLLNLARVCLAAGQPGEGTRLLAELSKSQSPWVARQAARELGFAQNVSRAEAGATTTLQAQNLGESAPIASPPPQGVKAPPGASIPVKFLKGTLVAVDCSAAPAAFLTVISAAKTWKFHVKDSKNMIILGAGALSCSWANRKVAVNFRETGDGAGDLVSLELQ